MTRQEAFAAGMTSAAIGRRIARGRWVVMHPTVYRVAGAPESWPQRVLAACLWSGGVASHRTAAHLWGFGDRPKKMDILVERTEISATQAW